MIQTFKFWFNEVGGCRKKIINNDNNDDVVFCF